MKNLLLFSALFLTASVSFAQLTVKPTSAGTDSYVYVNDQVLYVAKSVNLQKNTAGATEASIYLRNDAQLIQSGATSINTGDGFLSVQQASPETNQWGYYMWCSPVGNASIAPALGNTNFGVASIYQPTGLTQAAQAGTIAGPDGTVSPFRISTRWLYTFKTPGTEVESNYERMNAGNNAPPGFGFTMKGVGTSLPGNPFDYDFRGRPNSGNFTIPVGPSLMTLSGNPYPSALDLNKLFYDPANSALQTFWYYDEDRNVGSHNYNGKPFGYGVYTVGPEDTDNDPYNGNNLGNYAAAPFAIYTAGGSQNPTGGIGTAVQGKRFAPVGQGIMFVGNSVGNVTIKNQYRVFVKEGLANASVFQRPDANNDDTISNDDPTASLSAAIPTTAIPDYRDPQMRIWTIFNENITRDMLIVFYDQATDGFDRGLDGLSAQDMPTDAYFPIGNDNDRKPYVINGIKYDYGKQIPIAFKLKNQTRFEVKAVEEVRKPYTEAYLYDREQYTFHQITGGQSATLNLPAGKYDNRFFIVFRSPNVRRDAPVAQAEAKTEIMEKVNFFQNNPAKQFEIKNPEGYTLKSAAVYDMNGKLVINEKNLGDNNHYSFYTGNLSDGVYLVKLTTSEDITIDYKAIVHNK